MSARLGVVAAASLLILACETSSRVPGYTVINQFHHDRSAYTQGLVYANGWLFESTGRYGRSELRRVELETGRVNATYGLPPDRFGEGLAFFAGHLYQLTWKSGVGYVYDAATLVPVDSFTYAGEGWGLTDDGALLIKSNGTAVLEFIDPSSFAVARQLTVHDEGSEVTLLNELEFVRGELFANVYQSDWIIRIDLETGEVLQWLDMAGLLPARKRRSTTGVLNGIAMTGDSGHLLVTGKLWPLLFEIKLKPLQARRDLPQPE